MITTILFYVVMGLGIIAGIVIGVFLLGLAAVFIGFGLMWLGWMFLASLEVAYNWIEEKRWRRRR